MYFLLLVFLLLESKNEPELRLVIERTFALTGLFLSTADTGGLWIPENRS